MVKKDYALKFPYIQTIFNKLKNILAQSRFSTFNAKEFNLGINLTYKYTIANVRKGDIPNIVKMLADDELGSKREDYKVPLPKSYYDAFQNIFQDKNQELIILENFNKEIIGTLQLTFIQYLTYRGGLRAQIEAVRIQNKFRGKGFGKRIFKWAIKRSIDKGAHLVQLTTDKQRPDAIEFYRALGFRDSHMGMKLNLLQ